MKRILYTMLAFTVAGLFSCKREDFKTVGDAAAFKTESMAGTWTASRVLQTDEDAIRKNFPYKNLDVTTDFGFNQTKLTLNVNGSTPSTFSVAYGTAPKLFKHTAGNWAVDNLSKPTKLYLINGTDSVKININNYTSLANNQLSVKMLRNGFGKSQVGYDYLFTK